MKKFNSSDAWVLQAIARAAIKKPASLQEIISTGDMLNHAIFTSGELQCGLYKLYKAKYIKQINELYKLTDFGVKQLSQIINKKFTPMKELDKILEKINVGALLSDESLPKYNIALVPIFFTEEEFNRVCENYSKGVFQTVRKE